MKKIMLLFLVVFAGAQLWGSEQQSTNNPKKNLTQEEKNELLIEAARNNNTKLVQDLVLNGGVDVNYRTVEDESSGFFSNKLNEYYHRASAIHFAAKHGNIELVKFLIDHGACVNTHLSPECEDLSLATPLHIAAEENNFELVKLLVEKGASITAYRGLIYGGGLLGGGQYTPAELTTDYKIKSFLANEQKEQRAGVNKSGG